jgi:hypothetical protein
LLQDILIAVASFPSIVHRLSNLEDFFDPLPRKVLSLLHQFGQLFEFGEVALFLCGEKTEALKKRDDVFHDGSEVVHFVVPDSIVSLPHGPTLEVTLEQGQDHFITLGNIEAEGHFPGHLVVAPWSERYVEAALSIGETGHVIADI